ncbi:unnamed protein product [Urochloa decumbens]|uniref:F-box protein n=1 Tax=Urochloa decumbens TaxID=240449 RepID=A0ABC9FXM5_9POAL
MGGLPRRFLNLIVGNENKGIRSLRCVDLTRHQLFHPDTSPPGSLAMETIRLPSPTFRFKAWHFSCFPLADRKVLCKQGNRYENSFLFDADTRQVVTMPTLRPFNYGKALSLFVPTAGDDPDPDASLFFLQRWPEQEPKSRLRPESDQFQALVYRRTSKTSPSKSWQHQVLPPPPYLRDPWYWRRCTKIMSYAIVGGGGSHICISVDRAGTYCMDTVTNAWSKVGDWTLPFLGKVEYVPELKLWFGFSDYYNGKDQRLVAADLSCLDSGPELVGTWNWEEELDDTPTGWRQQRESQLVYLGSGKFCIVKFLLDRNTTTWPWFDSREIVLDHSFSVLTGLEVQRVTDGGGCSGSGGRHGGGKVELRLIKRQSRRTPNGIYIENAF